METCNHDFPLEQVYGFAKTDGWRGLGVCSYCPECYSVLNFKDDLGTNSAEEIIHNREKRNKMNAILGFGPEEDSPEVTRIIKEYYENSANTTQPERNI